MACTIYIMGWQFPASTRHEKWCAWMFVPWSMHDVVAHIMQGLLCMWPCFPMYIVYSSILHNWINLQNCWSHLYHCSVEQWGPECVRDTCLIRATQSTFVKFYFAIARTYSNRNPIFSQNETPCTSIAAHSATIRDLLACDILHPSAIVGSYWLRPCWGFLHCLGFITHWHRPDMGPDMVTWSCPWNLASFMQAFQIDQDSSGSVCTLKVYTWWILIDTW